MPIKPHLLAAPLLRGAAFFCTLILVVYSPVFWFTDNMLLRQIRLIAAITSIAVLLPLSSVLAATSAPAPPQFTIPAKERIVLYVADG